ncbi:MAG: cytochrome c family protein [Bacteroidetes bacterium]|nr:cytochrome c family protein [Bacteroidota bacterium]
MGSFLELITRTKGIEYLLALGFLFSFVGFWQWCRCREKRLIVRLAPLAVVALIFAGLASIVITSPATATPKTQELPSVNQAQYLANSYGSAKTAAHEHSPDVVSCQACHHHSPDGSIQACSSCHKDTVDANAADQPGLKAAYHRLCNECHTGALSGPTSCTKCHATSPETAAEKKPSPSAVTPPEISHSLLDHANCFTCHAPQGQLPLPANHANYKTNVECLGCHKSSAGDLTASTIPAVQKKDTQQTPAQPASQPATQPAAAPAQAAPATAATTAAPAKISHSVTGRENCATCHQVGGGMKPMPSDHTGRTDSTCLACHKAG